MEDSIVVLQEKRAHPGAVGKHETGEASGGIHSEIRVPVQSGRQAIRADP